MDSPRRILPPEWRQFLEDTLVHRAKLTLPGKHPTLDAAPTLGEVLENVPCFITTSRSRLVTQDRRDQSVTWAINLPPDCGVQIDSLIENGSTQQGIVLLRKGRVQRLDPEIDSDVGVVLFTAYVSEED